MTRAALIGIAALSFGLACTEMGRSVVLVEVTAATGVVGVERVFVHITQGGESLNHAMGNAPFPVRLGVYLPKEVSGPVNIEVCAFTGSQGSVHAVNVSDPVTVAAGETIGPIAVQLVAGTPFAVCGGTGGRGGAGGSSGGSAGGTSGTGGGGSSGGTGAGGSSGGSSGTGGAGVAGTGGGGAGTGGVAGTGGRGGTGGSAGTGGVAGTGGRGGSAGTGGGAGTGGRGGTGGTGGVGGTSGTGGAPAGWRGAVPLSTVLGQQTFPSVAVDANGNAVVVYEQGTQVWANRYDRSTGNWGTPGPVDSRSPVGAKPSVAVDRNGNYLAVWGMQTGTALQGIWYSTSTNGVQWSTAPASITTTVASGPVLAMNANGAAIVAWTEQVSGSFQQAAAAARTAPGAPWQLQVMRPGEDNGSPEPAVAISGNGNGFVGWAQDDGLGNGWYSVWMRRFTVGTGWDPQGDTFEKYTAQNAYDVSIAANAGGDAIATYIQISSANPSTVQLWSRRFSPTTASWATNPLQVFEASSIDTYVAPSVTLDDAGTATVAFAVQTPTGYQVQTSRTTRTDTMWPAAPTSMETDNIAKDDDPANIGYVTMPLVASDPAGNVTLIWRKRTAASARRFDLVSRRYTAGSWTPQVALENNTTNSVLWPTLAVGTGGTAVTTWHFATSLDVQANVFP